MKFITSFMTILLLITVTVVSGQNKKETRKIIDVNEADMTPIKSSSLDTSFANLPDLNRPGQ